MKICTVVGARPQFVKAAVVSEKIARLRSEGRPVEEFMVHTGQHYDNKMSEIFFEELQMPREKYNLHTGSGSHAWQTAAMLKGIEEILLAEKPDLVLVYGDTNSTLAGALAASKLSIEIAHVEAGMRSFNRTMPEEINRVVADHLSGINFCSSETALQNLKNEGRGESAVLVGDVMFDATVKFAEIAERNSSILGREKLGRKNFLLASCHRQENTDTPEKLAQIVEAFNEISNEIQIVFPIHPRTTKKISETGLVLSQKIKILPPVGYFDMLVLEKNAKIVLTDSGGVQKEAFFLSTPCVTMRDETEWVETVSLAWNIIAGASKEKILSAIAKFAENPPYPSSEKPYGDGDASGRIAEELLRHFQE